MFRFLSGVLLLLFSGICAAQDLGADLTKQAPAANAAAAGRAYESGGAFIEAQYYYYPPPQIYYPPPVVTAPVPTVPVYPVCNYGFSAVCGTFSGNICSSFHINYPVIPNQFSSCIGIWPIFQACAGISGGYAAAPVFSSGCHLSGTQCLCNFFGRYEVGYIL